jgi:hypothetical protein
MVTTAMVVLLLCGASAITRPSALLAQQDAPTIGSGHFQFVTDDGRHLS